MRICAASGLGGAADKCYLLGVTKPKPPRFLRFNSYSPQDWDLATMRIRSSYFKVKDMQAEVNFWRVLLNLEPTKSSTHWSEFLIAGQRIGFLLNDFDEKLVGCSSVPVLEVDEGAMEATVLRAKDAGAVVVLDGLSNPAMNSIVLASPGGHEFELCKCKAHE
jgi:Glyoxalase-like domain